MISLVTGATGAGISTVAASLAAHHNLPLVDLTTAAPAAPDTAAGPPVPAAGELGQALAQMTGLPAAGLDDVATSAFSRVVGLARLVHENVPDVVDCGSWGVLAQAVSDSERFAAHAAAASPSLGGLSHDGPAFLRVMELAGVLQVTRDGLRNADRVQVVAVVTAEPSGVATARDVLSGAALLGLTVGLIVVNRILPQLDSLWGRQRGQQQDECLAQVRELTRGCPVWQVGELATAPSPGLGLIGPAMLAAPSGAPLRPPVAESSVLRAPAGCWVRPVDDGTAGLPIHGGYELMVPIGPSDATVQAARRGASLLIQTGGVERQLPLSGALSRCTVTDGRRDGDWLVLTLMPDPRLWRTPSPKGAH